MEETRLGIPVLFHEESLHGLMATEATMFPMAIGLAGSFDRQLMEDVQSVIAREVRARGVHLALSPVVDIAHDSRWGPTRSAKRGVGQRLVRTCKSRG